MGELDERLSATLFAGHEQIIRPAKPDGALSLT